MGTIGTLYAPREKDRLRAVRKAVFIDFFNQRGALKIEHACGFRDIALGIAQGVANQITLNIQQMLL